MDVAIFISFSLKYDDWLNRFSFFFFLRPFQVKNNEGRSYSRNYTEDFIGTGIISEVVVSDRVYEEEVEVKEEKRKKKKEGEEQEENSSNNEKTRSQEKEQKPKE